MSMHTHTHTHTYTREKIVEVLDVFEVEVKKGREDLSEMLDEI
jgi:hypothetical protein